MKHIAYEFQFSRLLHTLLVTHTSYETGKIALTFKQHTTAIQWQAITYALKNALGTAITAANPQEKAFACEDIKNIRTITNTLIALNLVHHHDRPSLGEFHHKTDKLLEQRSKLTYSIDKASITNLKFVAETYIDDIIENCSDQSQAVTLLRAAFFKWTSQTENNLRQYCNKHHIDAKVIGSITDLNRICFGRANLETTYLRTSDNLPGSDIQRVTLHSFCSEKLTQQFSGLNDKQRFLMLMELQVYISGQQTVSPTADITNIISDALSRDQMPSTAQAIFKNARPPDLICCATKAFSTMGILNDEKRIQALQKEFNDSPPLKAYLTERRQRDRKVENKLQQALRQNHHTQVEALLNHDYNTHDHFDNGTTPLIIATLNKDPRMVSLLLHHNANPNQADQGGMIRPLNIAIRDDKPTIVKHLVAAKAQVSEPNDFRPDDLPYYQQRHHQGIPVSMITPLQSALTEYNRLKTPESKQIAQIILQHGTHDTTKFTKQDREILSQLKSELKIESELEKRDALLADLKKIAPQKTTRQQLKPVFSAVKKQEYGKALRCICHCEIPTLSPLLLPILKAFKKHGCLIELNKKVGQNARSALDYAANRKDNTIYQYLDSITKQANQPPNTSNLQALYQRALALEGQLKTCQTRADYLAARDELRTLIREHKKLSNKNQPERKDNTSHVSLATLSTQIGLLKKQWRDKKNDIPANLECPTKSLRGMK